MLCQSVKKDTEKKKKKKKETEILKVLCIKTQAQKQFIRSTLIYSNFMKRKLLLHIFKVRKMQVYFCFYWQSIYQKEMMTPIIKTSYWSLFLYFLLQ